MTHDQAQALVGRLIAAYPRDRVTKETVALYIEKLLPLTNAQAALAAVESCIDSDARFPTIATIRETYQRELPRHQPLALGEAPLTKEQMEFNKAQAAALVERLAKRQTAWVAE